jgi:hypothetical protein
MKIRRRAIEEHFKHEIEEMYSQGEVASVS